MEPRVKERKKEEYIHISCHSVKKEANKIFKVLYCLKNEFILSVNKYLIRIYYVLGTILCAEDTEINDKTSTLILSEENGMKNRRYPKVISGLKMKPRRGKCYGD